MTAVGDDVISSAAALRAGIVRVRPIEGPGVYGDEEEAPLMGSPVWPLTEGFIQTAAWIRLAQVAVEDVIRFGQLPPAGDGFWGETGLVWALPELGEQRFGWPGPETALALQRSCGDLLRKLTGLPRGAVADEFILGGACGHGAWTPARVATPVGASVRPRAPHRGGFLARCHQPPMAVR
ncbi:MAG: hypothetical protein EOO70_01540 [Myxococcaceae bacterium]|nr:MAG: hypothetical protein EOO70_01540 [Myxococcaceae bacterium]